MMIFGWTKRSFEATFRASAYSYGPLAFAVVPICGSSIGFIWSLVLFIIGLKHMQQTTGGKAAFTALLPLILCCCLVSLLVIVFGAAVLAFIQGIGQNDFNY